MGNNNNHLKHVICQKQGAMSTGELVLGDSPDLQTLGLSFHELSTIDLRAAPALVKLSLNRSERFGGTLKCVTWRQDGTLEHGTLTLGDTPLLEELNLCD